MNGKNALILKHVLISFLLAISMYFTVILFLLLIAPYLPVQQSGIQELFQILAIFFISFPAATTVIFWFLLKNNIKQLIKLSETTNNTYIYYLTTVAIAAYFFVPYIYQLLSYSSV